MKIALASDIHLEFGPIDLTNDQSADVLVLAGDICVANDFVGSRASKREQYQNFFARCCERFPQVVYILGNHEHYNGDAAKSYDILKQHLNHPNLHILDKESWSHQGHTFVCGTLWTDMDNSNSLTMSYCQDAMNDFREVRNSNRMVVRRVPLYMENLLYTDDGKNGGKYIKDEKGNLVPNGVKFKEEPSRWSPEDSVADHGKMMAYIDHATREPGSYIVVGHHCPSEQSVAECYKGNLLNGAFRSRLDDFILARPQIKLWLHGHTHHNFDYEIGSTRVVCNPRGYIEHEAIADSFKLQYLEI